MPLRLESSWASSKMRRLASVATRASCCSGVPSPVRSSNASAAMRDATSPAWAPPIPSATAYTGARA